MAEAREQQSAFETEWLLKGAEAELANLKVQLDYKTDFWKSLGKFFEGFGNRRRIIPC